MSPPLVIVHKSVMILPCSQASGACERHRTYYARGALRLRTPYGLPRSGASVHDQHFLGGRAALIPVRQGDGGASVMDEHRHDGLREMLKAGRAWGHRMVPP